MDPHTAQAPTPPPFVMRSERAQHQRGRARRCTQRHHAQLFQSFFKTIFPWRGIHNVQPAFCSELCRERSFRARIARAR